MTRLASVCIAAGLVAVLTPDALAMPIIALRVCDDAACDGTGDETVFVDGFGAAIHDIEAAEWPFVNVEGFRSGGPHGPRLDLVFDVAGTADDPDQLWIDFSAWNFTYAGSVDTTFSISIGPQTGSATLFGGSSNMPFDMSHELLADARVGLDVNPYSLTLRVALSHAGAPPDRVVRIIGSAAAIPEPTSLTLMGVGLAATLLARRRIRRRPAAPDLQSPVERHSGS